MSTTNKAVIAIIGLIIIAAIAYSMTVGTQDAAMEGDASAAGGTMLTGSEMPDNGMVGGDAMVGPSGDEMPSDSATAPKPETRQMQDGEPVLEAGAAADTQIQYKAKQGTSGSAR